MLTIKQIEQIIKRVFKPHLTGKKAPKYKSTDVKALTSYMALNYGYRQKELAKYFNCHHTAIIYHEKAVSDLNSYNKHYQSLLTIIKIELDNLIINSK